MKTVQEKLTEMLTDSTIGKSILDSGSIYGYNYEQYKDGVDFESPLVGEGEYVVINMPYFLANTLERDEYCEKMEEALGKLEEIEDLYGLLEDPNPNVLKLMGLPEGFGDEDEFEGGGFYAMNPKAWGKRENTYNRDTDFSQEVLYIPLTAYNGHIYIGIATHNGADIRGGYSDWGIFKLDASFDCPRFFLDDTITEWNYKDTGDECFELQGTRPVSAAYDGYYDDEKEAFFHENREVEPLYWVSQ